MEMYDTIIPENPGNLFINPKNQTVIVALKRSVMGSVMNAYGYHSGCTANIKVLQQSIEIHK